MFKHVSLIGLLFYFSSQGLSASKFNIQRIDRAAPGNRVIQMLLTENGDKHLVYTGCSDTTCQNSELFYANQMKGKNWQTKSVDASGKDTGWFPSLTLDAKGTPHIFYANHDNQSLRYSTQVNGSWQSKTLGSGRGGWWTSAGFGNGKLYMAHTKFSDGGWDNAGLEVGTFENGKWLFEMVDPSRNAGWFTSMSVLPNGNPVVSYSSVISQPVGAVKLAVRENNQWSLIDVDDISVKHHVTTDRQGNIHFVYQKASPIFSPTYPDGLHDLFYVSNISGSWVRTKIQEGGRENILDAGQMPRITVDAQGGLHVVNIINRDTLMYSRKMTASSDWETMAVDGLGSPIYPWIETSKDGQVAIAYEKGGNVYYASCEDCARHDSKKVRK